MNYRIANERHFTRVDLIDRFIGQDDAGAIHGLISAIQGCPAHRCVLDLSGLDFIDSTAISILMVINGELAATGRTLALVVGTGQVKRVTEVTRIGTIIPVHDTLDAYRASVPDAALYPHPCAPDEHPMALAARRLRGDGPVLAGAT